MQREEEREVTGAIVMGMVEMGKEGPDEGVFSAREANSITPLQSDSRVISNTPNTGVLSRPLDKGVSPREEARINRSKTRR